MKAPVDNLIERMDAIERRRMAANWRMIGLMITILLGQVALLARSLLG